MVVTCQLNQSPKSLKTHKNCFRNPVINIKNIDFFFVGSNFPSNEPENEKRKGKYIDKPLFST